MTWSKEARLAAEEARRLHKHFETHSVAAQHRWVASLGYPAYLVGGAVRDPLLGHPNKDEDFVVIAHPEQIKQAVKDAGGHTDDLIVRDRLVGVRAHMPGITPPDGVEIVPPRIEHSTGAGRHDFEIVPHPAIGHRSISALLADDATRRDFTVNALYKDLKSGEIVDPTGRGVEDAKNKVLRAVHSTTFAEDPLRILRGSRFVSTRGLTPDTATLRQMTSHAGLVTALTQKGVSGTVKTELDKLLMGDKPAKGLRVLRDTGALGALFPELRPMIGFEQQSKYHGMTADEHTFEVVQNLADQDASRLARLAALFHDSGKPESARLGPDGRLHFYGGSDKSKEPAHEEVGARIARDALNRVNYPREEVKHVTTIVQNHMLPEATSKRIIKARKIRLRLTDEQINDLIAHRRADMSAKGEAEESGTHTTDLDRFVDLLRRADEERAPRSVKDLAIDGQDLMALGMKPGPEIGSMLRYLLNLAVSDPSINTVEKLTHHASRALRKGKAA